MSFVLLLIVVLSWGFSWFAITLQLGEVAPLVSVAYRFVIAAAVMILWLMLTRRLKPIPRRDHIFLAAMGFCLFSMNFVSFYLAAYYLPSGILSVIFATAAIMGAINQWLFFRRPLSANVLWGAAMGIVGLGLLSMDSIAHLNLGQTWPYLSLPFLGTYLFSLGNLASVRLSRDHYLPNVIGQGMVYGALICIALCLALGLPFNMPNNPNYWLGLFYLAIIASVVSFVTYLSLVNREGPARAAYATVLFPIVAMVVSSLLEDFTWTVWAVIGMALALGGTVLVFSRPAR